jgi:predicted PolB exonuclease-like 3'-5' exonuclease
MNLIALDIETLAPDWVPGARGWTPDSFPPLAFHHPVVIAWITVFGDSFSLTHWAADANGLSDAMLLLGEDINNATRVITWNGRSFDMPLLNLVAMELGIDWSFWIDKRHRFPAFKRPLVHYDMKEQIGDYGAARGLRLDTVARRLGLAGKVDLDGAQVRDVWDDEPETVVRYCCEDVLETLLVYLRWIRSFECPFVEQTDKADALTRQAKKWARTQPELERLMGVIDGCKEAVGDAANGEAD